MGKIYLKLTLGVFEDASLQSSLSLRGKKGNSFCNFLINILIIYFSFSLYIMVAALRFFHVMRSAVN